MLGPGSSVQCLVDSGEVTLDLALDPAFAGSAEQADQPKPKPRGLAIVAHPHPLFGGTRDNKVVMTIARALTGQGFHVLRPNFRGVGQSTGQFDEGRGESRDVLALLKSCAGAQAPSWWPASAEFAWPEQRPEQRRYVLAGFSFGAFVQTLVARDITGIAPALALVGLAVSRFPAGRIAAGSLVVHGEMDDVVKLSDVLDWARPQSQPVNVIPGAGHFFHGQLVSLKALVTDFLVARYNVP